MSKQDRLEEILRRLAAEPSARSYEEAYGQLYRVMNEAEDELSGVSYNLQAAASRERMYPPQWDFTAQHPHRPAVVRMRSVAHEILIGRNGSILVRDLRVQQIVLDKAGEDGRKVGVL
jgi:hypothetical protein